MRLADRVTEYILQLGVPAAAEKFGRKESTIKTWMKSKSYPIDAVETYMAAAGIADVPDASEAPVTSERAAPSVSLEARVKAIEDYLVYLNQPAQPAQPQNPANMPRVAWAPATPDDGNFKSFIRPDQGVPGTVLSTPARQAPAGVRPGIKPADTWLTPIPRK